MNAQDGWKDENADLAALRRQVIQMRTDLRVMRAELDERKRMEKVLLESRSFSEAVLGSMVPNIVVLDGDGKIVAVNAAWNRFAVENGAPELGARSVGVNYLDVTRRATGPSSDEAPAALAGIEAVLGGRSREFTLEYPCHSPDRKRWFMMYAAPFSDLRGSAVIAHVNVTERRVHELALRDAHRRLHEVRENERRNLAIELHDSIGQQLVAMSMRFEGLTGRVGEDQPLGGELATLSRRFAALTEEVRRICRGLYPATLDTLGLRTALQQLLDETPDRVDTSFNCERAVEAARLARPLEIAAYRIAQEAVSNAVQHADAGRIEMDVSVEPDRLVLTITDDGKGFDPGADGRAGIGIRSMRDRAQTAGGKLAIHSDAGRTRVQAFLPLELPAAGDV